MFSGFSQPLKPKTAHISSLFDDNINFRAERCTDKNRDTICHSKGIAYGGGSHPWFTLEFEESHIFAGMMITNRRNCEICGPRLKDVKVFVSNSLPQDSDRYRNSNEATLLGTYKGPAVSGQEVIIRGCGKGKFIIIQYPSEFLNLAEVKAIGNEILYQIG